MIGVYLKRGVFGLGLGYSLSRIGFADYDELHRMFTLADSRMLLTFALGVVLTGLGFGVLRPLGRPARGRLHPGIIPGALLFGIGWVLCGACPGIAPVQLGEGRFMALVTIAGMVIGNIIYGRVHARYLRWDTGSCEG